MRTKTFFKEYYNQLMSMRGGAKKAFKGGVHVNENCVNAYVLYAVF